MTRRLLLACAAAVALAGCGTIPYRVDGFVDKPECRRIYDVYDDVSPRNANVPEEVRASPCWLRAKEERDEYDLLVVEFDDQGWVQGTSDLTRPARDHLDAFFAELDRVYAANRDNGLSLAVFVHGWHHNADARDANVSDFRLLLRDLVIAERGRKLSAAPAAATGPRVVGVYVGWRGESVSVPGLRLTTFWERKNTAERVAQGSVREFFERMDFLRDRGRDRHGQRNVRMLTIAHSFGGLITFESLSSDFLRAAVRSTGEYGMRAARRHPEVRQVAESVDHGVHAQRGQQESEHEAQAQRVIDRTGEHDQEHHGEQHALARRQDEYPPLHQHDYAAFPAVWLKQPVVEAVLEGRVHRVMGNG